MSKLFTLPKEVILTNSGALVPGALAYFYEAGTATPLSTYTDYTLGTAHAHPVVADGNGRFPAVYTTSDYKVKITDASGVEIYSQDYASPQISAAEVGAALYPQTSAESTAGVTPTNYQYEPGNVLRYGTNTIPGTTDMTTALTNALLSYNSIYVPEGNYLITAAITLLDDQVITGSGWRTTTISMTGASTRINMADQSEVRDLKLSGNGTQTFGISASATASRWRLFRVWVNNCVSGIGLNNCWINSIYDCVVRDCTNGILLHDTLSSNGPVNATNIYGGEIAACTYGIHIERSGGIGYGINNFNLWGVTIEPSGTYGVWVEDESVSTISFWGCYFELCGTCYRQDVGCQSVNFHNCLFDLDVGATDYGIHITTGITNNVSITGNEFDRRSASVATGGIVFESAAQCDGVFMQGNIRGDAAVVLTNNMTIANTAITAIADEMGGNLGSKLPKIRSMGAGSRPNSDGNNFINSASIVNPATTSAVTFSTAESDADYEISVFDFEENMGNYWVTSKTTSGFIINVATAPAGTATVHWMLTRR